MMLAMRWVDIDSVCVYACTAKKDSAIKCAPQVVIAGVGAKESPLSELLGYLPNSDCRYGGRITTS